MKSVAGSLKTEMAQFDSLATFAQFGAEDLDPVTRRQLARGERFRELLKQDENSPISYENMVALFHVANEGALDDVDVENVRDFEGQWYDYMAANLPEVLSAISDTGELSNENADRLMEAVSAFKQTASLVAA